MLQKSKKIIIIFIGIFCLFLITVAVAESIIMNSKTVLPGVYINGLDVGRMEINQVEDALTPLYRTALDREIVIKGEGKKWSFSPEQLGVKEDMEKTLKEAWNIGRQGSIWERWQIRWETKRKSRPVPLAFQMGEEILADTVKEMAQMIDQDPENAEIQIDNDNQVVVIPGKNGFRTNIGESVEKLKEVLQSADQMECELIIRVVPPDITEKEILSWEINGVVAGFETYFDPAKKDRSDNIRMAASALDHVLVMPQEIFSFNEVVGPRTTEAGYKESLVIENNEFTPGVGGGVCQVSTTLYNAVLLANLPILERHPHSLPISYVPPGLDATVSYNWADLTFLNDRKKPILLHTEYQKGKIKVMIFGTTGEFPQVKLSSKIVEYLPAEKKIIKDPSLAAGQTVVVEKGQPGMIVEVYREFISEGKTVSRELISQDKYKPQKEVIRISPYN
ncbi:MAG: VanW family protein [Bacillota bacterium]|nr:hypothetical protein [Clostridia bacterium]